MIRYLIRNKKTDKWLYRTKGYGTHNSWVDSVDNASLITTSSAATLIVQKLDPKPRHERYTASRGRTFPSRYDLEVVKVNGLLVPEGVQPFMNLKNNGNFS